MVSRHDPGPKKRLTRCAAAQGDRIPSPGADLTLGLHTHLLVARALGQHGRMVALPVPPPPDAGRPAALRWVRDNLAGLWSSPLAGSGRFHGGMAAASAALAELDVTGYASRRDEVWPPERRGASSLSPYIRHGLLALPAVWNTTAGGPARDVGRFHDELLWQEYARHLYSRLGPSLARPMRAERDSRPGPEPWDRSMACLDLTVGELEADGWLVNQTRMWLASQWSLRHGRDWREGEDRMFRHLLDGSRAANRLGWQWTTGMATAKAYGFSRWQVEKRAPGLCDGCVRRRDCPIQSWPDDAGLRPVAAADARLRADPDPAATAGPESPVVDGEAEAVWLSAESLGDDDPALSAHHSLPVVFVFDAPLLRRLQLSAKRLVFLAETLGDLAARRPVEVLWATPWCCWPAAVWPPRSPRCRGGAPDATTSTWSPSTRGRGCAAPPVARSAPTAPGGGGPSAGEVHHHLRVEKAVLPGGESYRGGDGGELDDVAAPHAAALGHRHSGHPVGVEGQRHVLQPAMASSRALWRASA